MGDFVFHLSVSNVREADRNVNYPRRKTIRQLEDLQAAASFDHLGVKMQDDHRANENFLQADVVLLDLDNAHTEDPDKWLTLGDVADAFPDVFFYAVRSRNYGREKIKRNKKSGETIHFAPRAKWHLYFPLAQNITNGADYSTVLRRSILLFPYMDTAAADTAHFFYGVPKPHVEVVKGRQTIDQYLLTLTNEQFQEKAAGALAEYTLNSDRANQEVQKAFTKLQAWADSAGLEQETTEANGEATGWIATAEQEKSVRWLEQWAFDCGLTLGRRYTIGGSKGGHSGAVAICVQCPWEDEHSMDGPDNESVILVDRGGQLNYLCRHSHGVLYGWREFRAKIEADSGYTRGKKPSASLEPADYTDVGQATVFVEEYGEMVRYSKATDFLYYTGSVWRENGISVQGLSQELTERQLREARERVRAAEDALADAEDANDAERVKEAQAFLNKERAFKSYVLGRRKTGKISATMTEARPMVQVDVAELDADPFLLNTPSGTVDLRTGQIKEHDPRDLCTKITGCSLGRENGEEFYKFLDALTCGDEDLKGYLQEVAGMAAVGAVFMENLIIATGAGGNGKSTFFGLLRLVLGDYAGGISADLLTTAQNRNKQPEIAELRGKRLVIAPELEEGTRLDVAMLKRLCSTDEITGEKKYKDTFSFKPSHTTVLYTNFLPKVGSTDSGTWSRLVVVPFRANFRGQRNEIKNYAEHLFQNCGGAVLAWVCDGAKRFHENGHKIALPKCVQEAIAEYRQESDWLQAFIDECCEVGPSYTESASVMYRAYCSFCKDTGDYCRNNLDFKRALEAAGFPAKRTSRGNFYQGIQGKFESVFVSLPYAE